MEWVPPTQESRQRLLGMKRMYQPWLPELPDTSKTASFAPEPLQFFKLGTKTEIQKKVDDLATHQSRFTDPTLFRGIGTPEGALHSVESATAHELEALPMAGTQFELDSAEIGQKSAPKIETPMNGPRTYEKADEGTRRQLMTLMFKRIENDLKWL